MALNDDWVADVRRWYFDERTPVAGSAAELVSGLSDTADPVGYEAALPALQLAPGELDSARGGRNVP
jgi:hypothetical protein